MHSRPGVVLNEPQLNKNDKNIRQFAEKKTPN